ncbi:MAG TPA: MFS transporter [Gammaproteobacteria bacterium]|nr:MFS transporter [Gammaproteobacteria bacterium]
MDLTQSRRGRRVLFALLYLAEGAPIGFIWWAIPTRLREAGVPVGTITLLTSVVILPWAFKFLWAPLVDVLRGPRWGRRGWVVATQLLMGLSLLPLALLDWQDSLGLLFGLLLLHAFAAATQDVAIDAWAISITPAEERGGINGWMQAGMLGGRWLFGAGFLIVAHRIDDATAIVSMVAIIWITTLVVLAASDRDEYRARGRLAETLRFRLQEFRETLGQVLRRRETWLGILLALVAFAGFKGAGDLAGPFLVDQGLAQSQVGNFFTGALVAMILGALAGGWAADRIGNARAIRAFIVIAVLVVVATAAVARTTAAGGPVVIAGMLGVYACAGLLTASTYTLLMQLTDPKLAATQFSAYMGAVNGCEAWAGFTAGQLAERFGYPSAFVAVALVSLLAWPLVGKISRLAGARRAV